MNLDPNLIGVIVGAGITGSFLMLAWIADAVRAYYRDKAKAEADYKNLRRLKLEHVLNELVALDTWIQDQLRNRGAGYRIDLYPLGQGHPHHP